jgi:hypothetical protein
MGNFYYFLCLSSRIFALSDGFFTNFCKNPQFVGIHTVLLASLLMLVLLLASLLFLACLLLCCGSSAADVCDVPIVSAAVANDLVVSFC